MNGPAMDPRNIPQNLFEFGFEFKEMPEKE
jgi:hypothetical protein